MPKKSSEDLKNPEQWDWESGKFVQPTKAPRTIVSVAFNRNEFRSVAEVAARLQRPVSAFIRGAAIEKARGEQAIQPPVVTSGNRGYVAVFGHREIVTGTLSRGQPNLEAMATS